MASRSSKRIIVVVVVIAILTLIFHAIYKEYSLTGIVQLPRPQFLDTSRIWRDTLQKEGTLDIQAGLMDTTQEGVGPGGWGEEQFANTTQGASQNGSSAVRIVGDWDSPAACARHNNIAFFKMHKCSSSTVQNILMRYGNRYDLNFVLPSSGNYLGTTYFKKQFAQPFPVKEYNILTHHTRFSKEGFESVMPANAMYVTIIRDPVTMYESTFTYLNYASRYGIRSPNAMEVFLIDPNRYYLPNKGKDHAKDSMLYDLGLENELKEDPEAVQRKIQQIASDFDLVMMTEYFAESLILLKHLMCWDFRDISYFKMNARSKTSVRTVSASVAEKIQKWNAGDVKLYDHFNRTFWEKVRAFGEERMREEVEKLEQINEMMKQRCIDSVVVNDYKVWRPAGIDVESLKVKPSMLNDPDCVLMAKTELPFTSYIRQKQNAKFYGTRSPNML